MHSLTTAHSLTRAYCHWYCTWILSTILYPLDAPTIVYPLDHTRRRPCCSTTVHSLYTHCTLTMHSLYTHCTPTMHSLYTHCTLTVRSLYTHCTLTVHPLYTHCTLYLEVHALLQWARDIKRVDSQVVVVTDKDLQSHIIAPELIDLGSVVGQGIGAYIYRAILYPPPPRLLRSIPLPPLLHIPPAYPSPAFCCYSHLRASVCRPHRIHHTPYTPYASIA
jgi:hypothetical protein